MKKLKHVWMIEEVAAANEREAKSYWTKIGVAQENADGSWTLQLSAVPVSGRMQIRDAATLPTSDTLGTRGAQ